MPRTCADCFHFATPDHGQAGFTECRRFPPVSQYYLAPFYHNPEPPILQVSFAYPGVTKDNPCCGEWIEKLATVPYEGKVS